MSTIGDSRNNFYSGSIAHLLAEDKLFIADAFVPALAAGSAYVIGITTGINGAAVTNFTVEGRSELTKVELFEGGTYSAGVPLELFNINRRLNRSTNPFTDTSKGVTVDTVGARILRKTILGSTDKKVITSSTGIGFVLKENTIYYLIISNDDSVMASDYDIQLVFAG